MINVKEKCIRGIDFCLENVLKEGTCNDISCRYMIIIG